MSQPQQVRILIIAKDQAKFQKAAQFLTRRGWPSDVVGGIKQAVEYVVKYRPTFVMVSFSFPNGNITKLPNLLSQTFNATCIAFAEGNDPKTNKRLSNCRLRHIFYGALSGPSIHMRIKKILMEMEREKKQQAMAAQQANNPQAQAAQAAQAFQQPAQAPAQAPPAAAPPSASEQVAKNNAQNDMGSVMPMGQDHQSQSNFESFGYQPEDNSALSEHQPEYQQTESGESYWGNKKPKYGADAAGYEGHHQPQDGGGQTYDDNYSGDMGDSSEGMGADVMGMFNDAMGEGNEQPAGPGSYNPQADGGMGVGGDNFNGDQGNMDPGSHNPQGDQGHAGPGSYNPQADQGGMGVGGDNFNGDQGNMGPGSYNPQADGGMGVGGNQGGAGEGSMGPGSYNPQADGGMGVGGDGFNADQPGGGPSSFNPQADQGNAGPGSFNPQADGGMGVGSDGFNADQPGGGPSSFNPQADQGNAGPGSFNPQADGGMGVGGDNFNGDQPGGMGDFAGANDPNQQPGGFNADNPFDQNAAGGMDPNAAAAQASGEPGFNADAAVANANDLAGADVDPNLQPAADNGGFGEMADGQVDAPFDPFKQEEAARDAIAGQKINNDLLSEMAKTFDKGFEQICEMEADDLRKIGQCDSVSVMTIRSEVSNGYLVFAKPDDAELSFDFWMKAKQTIQESLKADMMEIELADVFELNVEKVSFLPWAAETADFVSIRQHEDFEVAMAFFAVDEVPNIRQASDAEGMSVVNVSSIVPDTESEFQGYINFKKNDKMILYVKKGRPLSAVQKDRLIKKSVEDLYIPEEEAQSFRQQMARSVFDNQIIEYIRKHSGEKMAS